MTNTGRQVYTFGPFRVDKDERVVFREGQYVPLTPKAIAILLALLERHGHIVDKAELMEAVWPDTAVEESNLTQNIYSLRKVLGSRSECGIAIETMPRRGYRLVGEITFGESPVVPDDVRGSGTRAVSDPSEASRPDPGAVSVLAGVPGRTSGRYRLWWTAAALIAVVAALVYGRTSTAMSPADRSAKAVPRALVVRPVNTLPGQKMLPALSPDGEHIAFVWDRGDGHNLYVGQPDAESTLQLTRGPGAKGSPVWAPDGRSVAYVHRFIESDGVRTGGVYVISATGGVARPLWRDSERLLGNGLDWSPDGGHLAFSAKRAQSSPLQIALLPVAGGPARWLTMPADGDIGDTYPIFSPRGDSLAFVRNSNGESRILVQTMGSGAIRILPVSGHDIRQLAWTADGRSLIFSSLVARRLWRISLDSGETEPLPGLGEGTFEPAVARHQGRLVFRQIQEDRNLYRVALSHGSSGLPTTLARTNRAEVQPSISPDGARIAFVSTRTGAREVWVMLADGTRAAQVTTLGTTAAHPRWSPDGQQIVFAASATAARERHLFIVDAGGGLTRRLTTGSATDQWPSWSADGRHIYFTSNRGGAWEIWRVPSAGGQPEQVTHDVGVKATASADGQFLYYSTSARIIWRAPIGGGVATQVMKLPDETAWGGEWVLTARGIYWLNSPSRPKRTIEFYEFATGQSTVILTPSAAYDDGGGFSVSPSGDWLVFGQREYEASDIMMVDGVN